MACCYCQQKYSPKDCTVVPDVSARKQTLRSGGHCFNCLHKGHIGRTCRSPSKCKQCKGRHHTSICEGHSQGTGRPGGVHCLVQPSESPATKLNPEHFHTCLLQPLTHCSDQKRTVLLQTACGVVQNPKNTQNLVELCLLLNSGNQRSYLNERAKELLGLEPVEQQLLSIATFGSEREQTRVCPVVSVNMCLKGYFPMSLFLYVAPTICEPLGC